MAMLRNWMTVAQVSALTGFSKMIIYRWIDQNELRATKVGNIYKIPREEARAIAEGRHPTLPHYKRPNPPDIPDTSAHQPEEPNHE